MPMKNVKPYMQFQQKIELYMSYINWKLTIAKLYYSFTFNLGTLKIQTKWLFLACASVTDKDKINCQIMTPVNCP